MNSAADALVFSRNGMTLDQMTSPSLKAYFGDVGADVPNSYNRFIFSVGADAYGGAMIQKLNGTGATFLSFKSTSNTSSSWSMGKRDDNVFGNTQGGFFLEDSTASNAQNRFPVQIDVGSTGEMRFNRNVRFTTGRISGDLATAMPAWAGTFPTVIMSKTASIYTADLGLGTYVGLSSNYFTDAVTNKCLVATNGTDNIPLVAYCAPNGSFVFATDNTARSAGDAINLVNKMAVDKNGNMTLAGGITCTGDAFLGNGGAYQIRTDVGGAGTHYITTGSGDDSSFTVNNVLHKSWFGIGFSPSISGQIVPNTEYSHYFNCRNGNTGIRGYTKLGGDAPSIKMKKLTGTTASTEGGNASVSHGLTFDKIISVTILINVGGGNYISEEYSKDPGYVANKVISSTAVLIYNKSGNSANILSKPFTALITYEE